MFIAEVLSGRGWDGHSWSDVYAYVPIKPAPTLPVDDRNWARTTDGRNALAWSGSTSSVGAFAWSPGDTRMRWIKYGPKSRPWDAAGWQPR